MSCENVERLIRGLALGFAVLFVSGFLVLYYAIRKVACVEGLCSGYRAEIGSMDMLVVVFVTSVLFISILSYVSSRGEVDSS
ncbi:hypothetical protein A3L11_02615 [Thermococcus siculi]|uniref:Uncharacterized protein n=1 Tax=Thermococcus siculi TaxID=72803 RepID=A0A2Z2MKK9_9EURY|nr:hypothetical protein [Thermococcus siculi]ASJ08175.1 hypothetical protein A3L11_02615 [Thermococcus siculi]